MCMCANMCVCVCVWRWTMTHQDCGWRPCWKRAARWLWISHCASGGSFLFMGTWPVFIQTVTQWYYGGVSERIFAHLERGSTITMWQFTKNVLMIYFLFKASFSVMSLCVTSPLLRRGFDNSVWVQTAYVTNHLVAAVTGDDRWASTVPPSALGRGESGEEMKGSIWN